MNTLRRTFLAFALAFLLLSLQHERVAHSLAHLGTGDGQYASQPHQVAGCAQCELLAAGGDGIPASPVPLETAGACPRVPSSAFVSRATAAPACYLSRAPPTVS